VFLDLLNPATCLTLCSGGVGMALYDVQAEFGPIDVSCHALYVGWGIAPYAHDDVLFK